MNEIIDKNREELEALLVEMGESKFRGKQLFEWFHQKHVWDYDQMSNLPIKLRQKLKVDYPVMPLKIAAKYTSKIDGTIKYLFELWDSHIIESVLMRYKHGNSICISSQVGCRMGCKFCASTLDGRIRNLTPAEMLGQIYSAIQDTGERISNIVIMGSGEPLEELEVTLKFIELINASEGECIGQRHITVSTCGLVPEIRKLADQKLQINLALSLHATTDEKRRAIMPIANKYSIQEVLEACDYFIKQTGRRITFEYALIENQNDTTQDAEDLSRLLRKRLCHVNLIPVNKVEERAFKRSEAKHIEQFIKVLEKHGIPTTLRRTLGADIDAACGQLRRRYMKKRGE